jgi:hypothetical protein
MIVPVNCQVDKTQYIADKVRSDVKKDRRKVGALTYNDPG